MPPLLEILSQGEEVVTGQVTDTNAAWLAQQSVQLGFQITRHNTVGDKLCDLITVLKEIAGRADCCLCTGGLGPTTDDLTADAVAAAFAMPLALDPEALRQIEVFFQHHKKPMAASNRKQAMLPKGCIRLDNHQGTAPGFAIQAGRCRFIFMPGVPREMKAMFEGGVIGLLQQQFALQPDQLITLRTVGIGESDLQDRIRQIELPQSVQLGYRAEVGEVQVKLLFPSGFPHGERISLIERFSKSIGDPVYAVDAAYGVSDSLTLPVVIDRLMQAEKRTMNLLETLSSGIVSSRLSGVSWLKAALVLPQSICVSTPELDTEENRREYIQMLTNGFCERFPADLTLFQVPLTPHEPEAAAEQSVVKAITGVIGNDHYFARESLLAGSILRKQQQASAILLDVLRRYLQGLPVSRTDA
jgi:competence/damage-inducible protein CinA-like protein